MSSTNKTSNYELSQFLATDVPSWLVDYNGDNVKIDTQMKANAVAAAAAQSKADGADGKADVNAANIATLDDSINHEGTGLAARLTDVEGDVDTIESLIGNGTPTTTDQTIIGAINEINARVGSDVLQTTAQDVTGAINELDTDIGKIIAGKKYILIGDSYGNGITGVTGWISRVKTILGLTEGTDAFSYAQGGIGFVGDHETTFKTLLDTAHSQISDANSITDIFVAGGYNDIGKANVTAAIELFVTTAKTYFPRAKVTIAYNAAYDPRNNTDIVTSDFFDMKEIYALVDGRYDAIPNLYSILLSGSGFIGSDGIHPTDQGMRLLALMTARAIISGKSAEMFAERSMSFTPVSGITQNGTASSKWRRTRSEVRVWNPGVSYAVNLPDNTAGTNTWLTIGSFANIALNGVAADNMRSCLLPCFVFTDDNAVHSITGSFTISPTGELKVQIPVLKNDNSFYKYNEVTNIAPLSMNGDFIIDSMIV